MLKILIDENLPVELREEFQEFNCKYVSHRGWKGLNDADLLAHASQEHFDVLLTLSTRCVSFQDSSATSIAVLRIDARTSDICDLRPHLPAVKAAIERAKAGQVKTIKMSIVSAS